MAVNFAYEVSLFILAGILKMPQKHYRRGTDGFTSLPKEVVLRISIALEKSIVLGRV
jgi:hypothetical protein